MRFRLPGALAFLASLICVPAIAAAQQHPAPAGAAQPTSLKIPLVLTEGRLLVPVRLEGIGDTFFILDTAASGNVVSTAIRERLTLSPEMVKEQTVHGSTGSTSMEFVSLPSLSLGGESHDDQWAVVTDISDFRDYGGRSVTGILGTDLLAKYNVEIDVPAGLLTLHPHKARSAAAAGGRLIPFRSSADTNFVQFEATIDGRPVNTLLDTGARRGILNWKAAGLAGVGPKSPGLVEEQGGSKGIGGQRLPQYRYTFDGICLKDHCLTARELRIADLPVFGVVGWTDQPAMLVGVEWLEACPILISYSTDRLRVCG